MPEHCFCHKFGGGCGHGTPPKVRTRAEREAKIDAELTNVSDVNGNRLTRAELRELQNPETD